MKATSILISCCLALAIEGCGDSGGAGNGGAGGTTGTGGIGATNGTGGTGAMGGDPGTPALAPLRAAPRYAVVSSDYSETTIAVLDEDFGIIDESWINSGTTFAELVATLSGDVVLPNRQAGDGSFTVIDRYFTDVVSRFYVPSGNLSGQVRTHGEVADYSSNPHDLIFVDETSAWATRYEPNLDPNAAPENGGTDLIEIDPTTMELTGRRIDLSTLNTTGIVATGSGPVEVPVYARPSRGVRVGSILVVGLDGFSGAFDAVGPGMAAIVDLEDGSVEGLPLGEGLASCGNATPVPGAPTKVMVACGGFARPFGEEAQTRASAGVVRIVIDDEGARVERTWRATDDPDSAIAVQALVALDEERVAAVDFGDFAAGIADALYLMNIETGEQHLLHESPSAFEIGFSAHDPDTERLYVPDAGANAVIELTIREDGGTEVGSISIAPGIGFPPRAVYRLD
ncbi:MAG: hypothetical protein AAGF92_19005 [Myxococcota bacterium]